MRELFSGHLFHVLGAAALIGLLVFGLIAILVRFDKSDRSPSRRRRTRFEGEIEVMLRAGKGRKKRRSKK